MTGARFFDVLAAVDGLPKEDKCAFGWGACDAEHPCALHPSWVELTGCFNEWAVRQTLAAVPYVGPHTVQYRRDNA